MLSSCALDLRIGISLAKRPLGIVFAFQSAVRQTAMKAMLLDKIATLEKGTQPLRFSEVDPPPFGAADVLIRVKVCGVCHTELDEIEGRTPPSRLPAILGHQVIGEVVAAGDAVHP
jgi:D-arabinose 1-dehydrogenase-like Zn-dependent alcohol dehydrogenase